MNGIQRQLYADLMRLVDAREAFFFKDFVVDGHTMRIFNYRLASYTDFCEPGALECRGIMFELRGGEPVRLASMPMEKFFNLNENPFTMGLDLSTIVEAQVKADGSLLSTYNIGDKLYIKTKGSTESEQCIAALEYVEQRPKLYAQLLALAKESVTVNMEWCSPSNRIVLGYEKDQLVVLNCRCNYTGDYIGPGDTLLDDKWKVMKRWVDRYWAIGEWSEWAETVPDEQGIEGYVCLLANGQRIKLKTTWYLALHHTKDSINSPRRLFEACLEEATDDMRSLFHDDPVAISMIAEMEEFVEAKYNHLVDGVERFYMANKELERKDYAIKGQQELDNMQFGLAMQKYTGKEPDYKGFLKKKWKELGLRDREVDSD